jgi:hypothetical protein
MFFYALLFLKEAIRSIGMRFNRWLRPPIRWLNTEILGLLVAQSQQCITQRKPLCVPTLINSTSLLSCPLNEMPKEIQSLLSLWKMTWDTMGEPLFFVAPRKTKLCQFHYDSRISCKMHSYFRVVKMQKEKKYVLDSVKKTRSISYSNTNNTVMQERLWSGISILVLLSHSPMCQGKL